MINNDLHEIDGLANLIPNDLEKLDDDKTIEFKEKLTKDAHRGMKTLESLATINVIIDIVLKIIFVLVFLGIFCYSISMIYSIAFNEAFNRTLQPESLSSLIKYGFGFNSIFILIGGYWFGAKKGFMNHLFNLLDHFHKRSK